MFRLKFVLVILFLCGSVWVSGENHYIKPINGDGFFVEEIESQLGDAIVYENSDVEFSIPKQQVKLIEYLEGGVVIYNYNAINYVDVTGMHPDSLITKGRYCYIPFSASKIVQRRGSLRLRELVSESNFYKMADCKEEAHFILKYVFDDSGKDKAYFIMTTRDGDVIYKSKSVGASDLVPSHAGVESAEKLYKKYLKKYFNEGVLKK